MASAATTIPGEVVAAWVRATTAAQDLPERVTDTRVLEQVGTLLRTVPRADRGQAAAA